jgi:hypothetical protein
MSMKNWITGVCALTAVVAFAEQQISSEAVLQKTQMFALGGIGVAGTMSEGERALREILKQPDALARLEALLANGSPAGKLYALLGLRIKDRPRYERARDKFPKLEMKIETARGCMLDREPVSHLADEIERGQYDTFLDRTWPDERR